MTSHCPGCSGVYYPGKGPYTEDPCPGCPDSDIAEERERCAQVVWMCRGHCVTDDAAKDLMEHVRRTP